MNGWPKLVDATVSAYRAARIAHLDAVPREPFDVAAHSTKVRLGSKVGYAHRFLKSIGAGATDPMWFARGRVTSIRTHRSCAIATVLWRGEARDLPPRVNAANLAPVGPNLAFCGN